MTAACTHGMPTPAACFECMEDGNIEPPPAPTRPTSQGWTIDAAFPGHCQGCNLPIHEGQSITRMSDDTWQHARCAG